MIFQGPCIASHLPYEEAQTETQSDPLSTNQTQRDPLLSNQSRASGVCSNGCPVCCTKALQPSMVERGSLPHLLSLVTLLNSSLRILSGVDMCHPCQNMWRSRNELDNHVSNDHNIFTRYTGRVLVMAVLLIPIPSVMLHICCCHIGRHFLKNRHKLASLSR